jgi:uncharacterized protein YfaS (alpha-2-macroglobulin family)
MTYKDVFHVPPVLPNKMKKRINSEVAPLRKQRKKLTNKEWTFVQELVSADGQVTMKEAAIRAGYKPASASAMAWQLTNPKLNPSRCLGHPGIQGGACPEIRDQLRAPHA